MNQTTKAVLEGALAKLENGNKWIKDSACHPDGSVCIRTAIHRAAKDLNVDEKAAKVQFSKTLDSMNLDPCIPFFNDNPNTNFKLVKEVFEEALLFEPIEEVEETEAEEND